MIIFDKIIISCRTKKRSFDQLRIEWYKIFFVGKNQSFVEKKC